MTEKILQIENEHISNVFGELDANVRRIEEDLGVAVVNRGDSIKLTGPEKAVEQAAKILLSLEALSKKGERIEEQQLLYLLDAAAGDVPLAQVEGLYDEYICLTTRGKPIKPKTLGQKKYVESMKKNTLVFGLGPAGTGKTYLAMAMAITAFKRNEVARIVLTRPAIEAGEKLGFLPGNLQQKVDPYLRPLYDALYEIMGAEAFAKNMEKGAIEVAPLAYMRGRTLDNAFIVLDEAQNTTQEQMKMFLTRLGFGSKAVITGDLTQIDLPEGKQSGLLQASRILTGVEDVGVITLTNRDVVRHPLVQRIILAYEKAEGRERHKSQRQKRYVVRKGR